MKVHMHNEEMKRLRLDITEKKARLLTLQDLQHSIEVNEARLENLEKEKLFYDDDDNDSFNIMTQADESAQMIISNGSENSKTTEGEDGTQETTEGEDDTQKTE